MPYRYPSKAVIPAVLVNLAGLLFGHHGARPHRHSTQTVIILQGTPVSGEAGELIDLL